MARRFEEPAIGIDLGTTYSRVAVWHEQMYRAEIIHNEQGNRTTPSFVAFTDDQRLIGDPAKTQAASNAANTIFDAKMLIGRKYSDPIVQNNLQFWPFKVISSRNDKPMIIVKYKNEEKCFFAEEITSMVIKKMRENAENFLELPVKHAVITVPAYFNDIQRKATKDAGAIAGLNVMQIMNEPTAAALAYGFHLRTHCVGDRNICICDLGGGTFDVSLITFKDDKYELKATGTHIGGEDFNHRMVNHFAMELKRKHKIDISGNSTALRRLRTECERAIRILSFDTEVSIAVGAIYQGIDLISSITRAKFEQLNIDLFYKCMHTIESCLTNAKIEKSNVDDVYLVGGSFRIPKMCTLLHDFFGKEKPMFNIFSLVNRDEAVVSGAAMQAALLSGGLKNVPNKVYQYLTRLSLAEPIQETEVNDKKVHVTMEDNKSSVMVNFQEGVGMTVNVPGSFNISVPLIPRGLPFNVCFDLDSDGMLNISAEVQTISKEIIITNENVRVELRTPR